jgi:hypothetical protein
MRALERDPDRRYATAAEFADALRATDNVATPAEVGALVSRMSSGSIVQRRAALDDAEDESDKSGLRSKEDAKTAVASGIPGKVVARGRPGGYFAGGAMLAATVIVVVVVARLALPAGEEAKSVSAPERAWTGEPPSPPSPHLTSETLAPTLPAPAPPPTTIAPAKSAPTVKHVTKTPGRSPGSPEATISRTPPAPPKQGQPFMPSEL